MNSIKLLIAISSCVIVQGTILNPKSCQHSMFDINTPLIAFENYRKCVGTFEHSPAEERKSFQEALDHRFRLAWLIYSNQWGFKEADSLLSKAEKDKLIPPGDWLKYAKSFQFQISYPIYENESFLLTSYYLVLALVATVLVFQAFHSCYSIKTMSRGHRFIRVE